METQFPKIHTNKHTYMYIFVIRQLFVSLREAGEIFLKIPEIWATFGFNVIIFKVLFKTINRVNELKNTIFLKFLVI